MIPSIVEDIKALEIWGSEPNQASLWSPQSTVKIYSITKKTHLKVLRSEKKDLKKKNQIMEYCEMNYIPSAMNL